MSVELVNKPIDVMMKCSSRGVVDPVRLLWRKREIRLESKPAKVDKRLGSQTRDYWCRNGDGANVYHLRWDVQKMEWVLVSVEEG